MIICAAIMYKNKVFRGHRHSHCFQAMEDSYNTRPYEFSKVKPADVEAGFVDSFNSFLDRDEALEVARACGQVDELIGGKILTSEDLY